jgi:hypothetical protein
MKEERSYEELDMRQILVMVVGLIVTSQKQEMCY